MPARDSIRRLRVRAARDDTPALRLAVSGQLGAADLRLPGTPPSEVLLVRALRDPLPGRIASRPFAAGIDRAWERALRNRLQALRSAAVRPRGGRVDAGAEAVLFADEAEMIACLAQHRASARSATPWWDEAIAPEWRRDGVDRLLARRPEILPAVFSILARWGAEARVAAVLADASARTLIEALAQAVGSPLVVPAALRPGGAPGAAPGERSGRASPEGARREAAAFSAETAHTSPGESDTRRAVAPWRNAWRPGPQRGLSSLQELLVGFALALQRAPAQARSARFARQADAWLRAAGTGAGETRGAAPAGSPTENPAPDVTPMPVAPTGASFAPEASRVAAPPDAPPGRGTARRGRAQAPVARPDPPQAAEDVRAWGDEGMPTELGGLLYLINLMEHLDLPECFESDCALASAVGAFGTLEAIGRALLGALPAALEEDALWALLARLDQRARGEPPRAGGLSAQALRLPPAWLREDADAPRPLRWATRDGRLLVWSTAGYPLANVPLAAEGRRQALSELAGYAFNGQRGLLEPGSATQCPHADMAWLAAREWAPPLVQWLEFVAPFLRWRLARALGLARPQDLDALNELARLPARLYVTDTHIDIVASLEAARAPLRLSGLDRSPGWVRRLSRVVLVHFE